MAGDAPSGAVVIAVANCKGGCGKTTTAVNIAAEIGATGRRTLLLDLDPQGHGALGFGISPAAGGATAHDWLRGSRPRPEQVYRSAAGVDVLPADASYSAPWPAPAPRSLAPGLEALKAAYDVIVIDTPPAADLPLVAALAAARYVLAPSQLTPLARDGLMRFSQVFFYAATNLNPDLQAFAIAPTQVDLRTRIQQATLAGMVADFGLARMFPALRSDVTLAEAFGAGLPIRAFRPAARGAADYARLAERIEREWLAPAKTPTRAGSAPPPGSSASDWRKGASA